jgi:formiminotetrahydrofolate cyclodeaminase
LSEAIAQLSQLREELKAAIDADAESYNSVMKAYKQAKESANADGMIDAALKQATSVPLSVAERAREVAGIAEKLGAITNPNMKSDLTTAIALARAAIAERPGICGGSAGEGGGAGGGLGHFQDCCSPHGTAGPSTPVG